MSPERELLRAFYELELSGGGSRRSITVVRRDSGERCLVVDPVQVVESLGLGPDASSSGGGTTLKVIGEGAGSGDKPWRAALALTSSLGVSGASLTFRTGPSALAFLLAGVSLPRDLIASQELEADLGSLSTLNQVIEHRHTSLERPLPLLTLWSWGELEEAS